jgi:dUTP pyrophosphatase
MIKVKSLREGRILGEYATDGSAAIDLRADIQATIRLYQDQRILIGTGVAIHIGDRNLAGIIIPRSGMAHNQGILLGNGVGLIDSDYQGEVKVSLWNTQEAPLVINPDMRIAQMIFIRIEHPYLHYVDSFEETARGVNGFGSTGVE